ncbi:hypothetical protein PLEOSDRAFT_1104440 [Pleurotus ostreatus PC15]|uniref:Uncharacterized protein n=1 Tax=Pleurotus ostreatus (strain PC15) TaxID=1137138 RepID=A0A067NIA3_PLEO1|nr:hypothetical protein PLEOSDRAFT_1104440 [Pleurotus ostreatus PC15]
MMEIATPVIAGMVLGIVCLNLVVAAAWFWVRKSRSKAEGQETPSGDHPSRPTHSIASTNDARNPIPSTSLQPSIQPPNMYQIADNTVSRHSFGSILDSYSHPPYKKPPTATLADRKRLSACSASVTLDSSSLYSADSAREEGRDTVPHTCTSLRPNPRVPYPTPRPLWPHQQINGDHGESMSSVCPSASPAPRVRWTAPGRSDCAVPTIESTPSSYVHNSPASTSENWAYSPRSPLQPVSPLRLERKPLFLSRNAAPPSINSSSQRLSLVSSSSEQPLLPGRHGKADATHYEDKTEASSRGTTFAA